MTEWESFHNEVMLLDVVQITDYFSAGWWRYLEQLQASTGLR